jgi:hypothetical protein
MIKKTIAILIIIAIVVIVPVSPYIKAEYLTYKYGDEFEDLYKDTHMIDNVDYGKVLEYSPSCAKVCYVARGSGVHIFEFRYKEDRWQRSDWKVAWSKSGSADILDYAMWPMYF